MIWKGYLAALLAAAVLDALWLGLLARNFYATELGGLMRQPVAVVPAALFYLAYPMGLLLLALQPMPPTWAQAVGRSALLGLVAYGVYDLTNLATINGWSLRLALVDMAWGTAMSAVVGAAAYAVMLKWPAT